MDGLALLCNLFADGPVTLRRLRPHVPDLATLERTPAADLADWIQCSVPQARAFAEEAAILRHRIGEAPAPGLQPGPGPAASRSAPPAPQLSPAPIAPAAAAFAGFGMRSIASESATAPQASQPEPVGLAPAERAEFERAASEVAEPGPASAGPGAVRADGLDQDLLEDRGRTLLRPGLLPGLDASACVRLAERGVRTVRALAEGAGLALSRGAEIPYSRLLGLARAARALLRGEDPSPLRDPPRETGRAPAPGTRLAPGPATPPEPIYELRPGPPALPPLAAPARGFEPLAHDPFALPVEEPESAGPFG